MNKQDQFTMIGIFERVVEELHDDTFNELLVFLQTTEIDPKLFVKELFAIALDQHRYRMAIS